MKPKAIKLLEKNIEENPCNFRIGKYFLDKTQKVCVIKETIDKFDFMKIKDMFFEKLLLREWKNKPQTGKKIAKHISDKELASRMCKDT